MELQESQGDSKGAVGYSDLITATGRLGSSFASVESLDGATYFSPTRHDGAASVAPFAWVSSCACVRYTGAHTRFTR